MPAWWWVGLDGDRVGSCADETARGELVTTEFVHLDLWELILSSGRYWRYLRGIVAFYIFLTLKNAKTAQ